MANADILLPDGTKVTVQGSAEEVAKILSLYSSVAPSSTLEDTNRHKQVLERAGVDQDLASDEIDIARIVACIRDCDAAESIEVRILDQRDAMNRVLLPLYIQYKFFNPNIGLTSGNVQKITDQLGVKVEISSASKILSGRAKSYVSGDSVRKKGSPVRYKLTRRGVIYFEELIN